MDISDPKQLREAEQAIERLSLLSKATHDVIWDWDLLNNTLWWNDGINYVFGYNTSDLEPGAESWYNRIHPNDKDRILKSVHEVIDRGGSTWSGD